MKNQCHKGLLIPWLWEALDKNLFEGLGWENEEEKIFFIVWTHKSAEHWTIDVLQPFRAWAEFKGKLSNKNPKTLKATFRCALNSKKDELRELKRQRNRRFWQFIDPKIDQGKLTNKKGPKPNSKRMTVEPNNRVSYTPFTCSTDSTGEAELFGSTLFPSFESIGISLYNIAQYEDSKLFFDFADFFKSSEEKTLKKRKRRTDCKSIANTSPNMKVEVLSDVENQLTNCFSPAHKTQKHSRADKLPPFQSLCNFQPLTPPYQDNEIFFTAAESNIGINSPDANRLTPPLDAPPRNYSFASSPYHQQLSTDVWQPNCWSVSSTQQSFTSMNTFSADLDEMTETAAVQKQHRGVRVDFAEMDQFVPVMNVDNQVLHRDEPFSSPCKPVPENNPMSDQMLLEDLLICNYPEAYEKIFQELNNMSSSLESGEFNYNS